MLTAGVAVWRAWCAAGGAYPKIMAGHSLGEYTALVCAGAMAFEEALDLVTHRARVMQEAAPAGVGAIAAVLGPEDERLAELSDAEANGEVVTPANLNASGQVVVAGHPSAVERVLLKAKKNGAKRTVLFKMSVPAHSPLMQPADFSGEQKACIF